MLLSYSQPVWVSIIDCPTFSDISFAWSSTGDNSQIGNRSENKNSTYNYFIQGVARSYARTLQINSSFRLIFLI